MDIELTLTTPAYGGSAMGRDASGRAVFVPFALPGETVRARVVEEKRGFVRAALLEVLNPSPRRIPARCAHFTRCGGCHLQHLDYPDQLAAKRDILRDQLQRIGKLAAPPVQATVPSPAAWNYRNHVQFHLAADGRPGFASAQDAAAVLPIQECHLPAGPISAFWPRLSFEPGAPLARVAVRAGDDDELMLILEADDPTPPALDLEAEVSVIHLFAGHSLVLAGADGFTISVCGRPFRVSAASFFQVNTPMAERMVTFLLDHLPVTPEMTLLDVYCGVGLFSAFFAPRLGQLIGIESSPAACLDFEANLAEFDRVSLYEAPAAQALPALALHPDVVILDPPRAGLEAEALAALLAMRPQRIAYVSCDPATLARDAARLVSGGYRLLSVTPFDLFPQTYHIESISLFEL